MVKWNTSHSILMGTKRHVQLINNPLIFKIRAKFRQVPKSKINIIVYDSLLNKIHDSHDSQKCNKRQPTIV